MTWIYSPSAQSTKFHLPGTTRPSSGPAYGVATRCGNVLIGNARSLEPPEHLHLCDECVLADVMQPSVYRFFDEDDRLLYVGCSSNVLQRFRAHGSPSSPSAAWWSGQRRHSITTYPTKPAAFAAEALAIATEHPLFPQSSAAADRLVAA